VQAHPPGKLDLCPLQPFFFLVRVSAVQSFFFTQADFLFIYHFFGGLVFSQANTFFTGRFFYLFIISLLVLFVFLVASPQVMLFFLVFRVSVHFISPWNGRYTTI
jgi:hypothetical protein